eukprot:m.79965 g.79965  ORF g.79965 m.79965 type:complete len:161 (+) comp12734_c0_seq6:138-620(+)
MTSPEPSRFPKYEDQEKHDNPAILATKGDEKFLTAIQSFKISDDMVGKGFTVVCALTFMYTFYRTKRAYVKEIHSDVTEVSEGDILEATRLAYKALGIATFATTTIFGLGSYGVSEWLGVSTLKEFGHALRDPLIEMVCDIVSLRFSLMLLLIYLYKCTL